MIENKAEKLKIKERLANAKARIQVYNNIELENGNEKDYLQSKVLEDNWMRSIRTDNDNRIAKIEIEQERGAVITRKEQNIQHRNTFYIQDKIDWVNLPNETVK